jgi:NAD(P)-dependent dehydrogenase (short-subunit alcohol dehydrogenase family)
MSGRLLEGKVALVTGASRGIGAAAARAFAAEGAAVTLAARDRDALDPIVKEIEADGGRAISVRTDVTDAATVAAAVDATKAEFGRLDAAFNNAGGGHAFGPLAEIDLEEFDDELAVNLRGVFVSMKHEIPAMLEGGGGAIVNNASTAGIQAARGISVYSASKAGVIVGLTKTASLDYAQRGVRINAVAPGSVLTDLMLRGGEKAIAGATAATPMRRIGEPEEVAAAAVWLCSDQASYVTGATLPVDGGRLAGYA